jgi:hypothetical protein
MNHTKLEVKLNIEKGVGGRIERCGVERSLFNSQIDYIAYIPVEKISQT